MDNVPISDVPKKIFDDAETLKNIIDKLREENLNNTVDCSFNYKRIEENVKVENYKETDDGSVSVEKKWCFF